MFPINHFVFQKTAFSNTDRCFLCLITFLGVLFTRFEKQSQVNKKETHENYNLGRRFNSLYLKNGVGKSASGRHGLSVTLASFCNRKQFPDEKTKRANSEVYSEIVSFFHIFVVFNGDFFSTFSFQGKVRVSQYTCEACGLELQKKRTFPDPQGK